MQFSRKFFYLILAMFALETLSFLAYTNSLQSGVVAVALFITFAIIFWKKLEWGIYVALAELIIGSLGGYLFSVKLNGFDISLRLGFFIIIFLTCGLKKFQPRPQLSRIYWLLPVIIIWGVLRGLIHGNDFINVFFDANGYLFWAYILIFTTGFKSLPTWPKVVELLSAAVTWIFIKTSLVFLAFVWRFNNITEYLYHWIRDTHVGSITVLENSNFVRVFFQGHFWSVIAFFVLLSLYLHNRAKLNFGNKIFSLFVLVATSLTILLSFSRSLWVGTLAGLGTFIIILILQEAWGIKKISRFVAALGLGLILEILLVQTVVALPRAEEYQFTDLLFSRTSTGEAASNSRLLQLAPLWQGIKQNPVLGSGFGATITYQTEDPLFLSLHPDGRLTTYAFEWGYLDIILKVGFVGLIIYLITLGFVAYKLFRAYLEPNKLQILYYNFPEINGQQENELNMNSNASQLDQETFNQFSRGNLFVKNLSLGLFCGLIALLVINVFTPYLNHPLGIGLMLVAITLTQVREKY